MVRRVATSRWYAAFLAAACGLGIVTALALPSRPSAAGELTFVAFDDLEGGCEITIYGPGVTFIPLDPPFTASLSVSSGTLSVTEVSLTPAGGPGSTVGSFTFIHYTPAQPTAVLSATASNGWSGSTTITADDCKTTSAQPCQSLPVNSASARSTQQDGAVANAVGGGGESTTTTTTSTTHHQTHTTVNGPDINTYVTRVIGMLDSVLIFDVTVAGDADDPATLAAYADATAALQSAGGGPVTGPALTASSQSNATAQTGEVCTHEEYSVTTTTTFGPAVILIGEDQSETFFVPAGTVNVNTNTHTESFIDDIFQTTMTHSATYALSAAVPTPTATATATATSTTVAEATLTSTSTASATNAAATATKTPAPSPTKTPRPSATVTQAPPSSPTRVSTVLAAGRDDAAGTIALPNTGYGPAAADHRPSATLLFPLAVAAIATAGAAAAAWRASERE